MADDSAEFSMHLRSGTKKVFAQVASESEAESSVLDSSTSVRGDSSSPDMSSYDVLASREPSQSPSATKRSFRDLIDSADEPAPPLDPNLNPYALPVEPPAPTPPQTTSEELPPEPSIKQETQDEEAPQTTDEPSAPADPVVPDPAPTPPPPQPAPTVRIGQLPPSGHRSSAATSDLTAKHVRFGDHSITTSEMLSDPFYDIKPILRSKADFCRRGILFAATCVANFEAKNDGYYIKSHLIPVTTQGAAGAPVEKEGQVFPVRADPFTGITVHDYEIRWMGCRQLGTVPASELTPFCQGGVASARFVGSMLQPELRAANNQLCNNVSTSLFDALDYFDNEGMYAKLIYYALLIDLCAQVDCVPIATAFPAGVPIRTINLDDANLDPEVIIDVVQSGHITLLPKLDYSPGDIQVIYWLAAEGKRIHFAEATSTPHAAYIKWPAIPINLFKHGAAAAAPAAAMVTSDKLLAFAYKTASLRSEWDSLTRGLYIALDILGVRYHTIATNHAYHVTSNHNAYHTYIPGPTDYNFMLRVAKIFPKSNDEARLEFAALNSFVPADRIRGACLYSAALSAFSTTLLHSLSFTTKDILAYCNGVNPDGISTMLLTMGFCLPRSAAKGEAALYTVPKAAFKKYLGFTVLSNLYPRASWQGDVGENANAVHSLAIYTATQPPRLFTLSALDNFLTSRPPEWGILGPDTHIDAQAEVRILGPAAIRGVFSKSGDKTYSDRIVGGAPYKYVPYGVQLMNAITQSTRAGVCNLKYNACEWHKFKTPEWAQAQDAQHISYDAALFILEPCSLVSFDYTTSEVRAPAFGTTQLDRGQLGAIQSWRGGLVDDVGYYLDRSPRDDFAPVQLPDIVEFDAMGCWSEDDCADDEDAAEDKPVNPP